MEVVVVGVVAVNLLVGAAYRSMEVAYRSMEVAYRSMVVAAYLRGKDQAIEEPTVEGPMPSDVGSRQ